MFIVCIRRDQLPILSPDGDVVLPAMLTVLQQRPEMTVDKQWEQPVTPTSIDLAPSPPPPLANNATLIPPTLNLYESPRAPPPSSTRTDKNDKWPTPSCLSHLLPVHALALPDPTSRFLLSQIQ